MARLINTASMTVDGVIDVGDWFVAVGDHDDAARPLFETDDAAMLVRRKSFEASPCRTNEAAARGLRGDGNASVHTVWSQYGFGWRDDPNVADGDPRRLLTFKVDQATIEAKVLKAALLVDQLMDLQDRCNRLQVGQYYKKDVRVHLNRPRCSADGFNGWVRPEYLTSVATPAVATDPQCDLSPLPSVGPHLGTCQSMGDLVQDRVADFPLIVQSDQQSAHSDGLAPVVAATKTTRCSIEPELPVVQLVQTHVQEGQARGVV